MSDWQNVRLDDVAEVIMGQSPTGDTYNRSGDGSPLLNGPTEFGNSYPTPALWTNAPTKICQEGDLLFCVRGSTTGRMNWADQSYCLGRGIGAIRGKAKHGNTRFVFYALCNELPRLLSLCSGSVFPNLSRSDIAGFEISVPSLTQQNAIARILGSLDDKTELNRRMNKTLATLAHALFKTWFVDFEPFGGNMPEDWQIKPIGDCIDVVGGTTPSTNNTFANPDAISCASPSRYREVGRSHTPN